MSNPFATLPTLLDITRLTNIIKYSCKANTELDSNALFCEFGSYKGGSAEVIAKFNPNRPLFVIDSFQGLPPTDPERDFHHESEFSDVDYLGITGYFKMLYKNVRVLKGFSPDIFNFFDEHARYSFVHVDCDIYSSCSHAIDFFYPRLIEGGFIIFDDYGFSSCKGVKTCVDEFAETIEPKFKGELIDADRVSSKQYLIVK